MSEPVMLSEFQSAIKHLSDKVEEGNGTTKEVLAEAKKTNGRVYALERSSAELAIRLAVLEGSAPLTKRDLWTVTGTLGAALAAVKWLPALLAIGQVAP